MFTASRLFLVYVVAESAALIALVMTIGFGWTLLLFTGAFAAGIVLAGAQVRAQLSRLLSGRRDGALGDGALVALGTLAVVIPGLISTAVGLLLLAPPTRPAIRPVLKGLATAGAHRYATGRRAGARDEFIDGEVIDVVDVETRALSVD